MSKCWYYGTGLNTGKEMVSKKMNIKKIPDEVKKYKSAFSEWPV